jgi:adenylate kinase
MNIILLYGPPASGKTTLAKGISNNFDISYLSVGQITRREIANKTDVGHRLKKYLDDVVEYPVEFIGDIVEKELDSLKKSGVNTVLLDGFPKYFWEAEKFLNILKKLNLTINKIIIINLTYDDICKRASNRRICLKCLKEYNLSNTGSIICPECGNELVLREDDSAFVLKRRYGDHVFSLEKTLKVLDIDANYLVEIDGSGDEDTVLHRFSKELV